MSPRRQLASVCREEMLGNPILEDGGDTAQEQSREQDEFGSDGDSDFKIENAGHTETTVPQGESKMETATEVKADAGAVGEIDWADYLDKYSSAPPMPSGRVGGDDELPSLEATLTRGVSLFEHLMWQLKNAYFSDEEKKIAMMILGNLDSDGYLKDPPLSEIAADAGTTLELTERVLRCLQSFDPVGVCARSLEECLLVQAEHRGITDELVLNMLRHHLGNLEKKNYAAIARDLKEPLEEIYEASKVIMELDPRPGKQYSADEPHYITPDVYIHKVGDKFFVVPNDDGLPKLKISNFYRSALAGTPKAREYIQDKLRSAQWLIRSIQQRQDPSEKVTESNNEFQREFFEKGVAYLKPLILRDVAEDIGMHESTISRVTTAKYVHTPQGLFELKYFFNSGIARHDGDEVASEAVKNKIKAIIGGEDPKHPHSDQKIVELLADQNIDIARRTVAQYREQLGILSSSKSKQVF